MSPRCGQADPLRGRHKTDPLRGRRKTRRHKTQDLKAGAWVEAREVLLSGGRPRQAERLPHKGQGWLGVGREWRHVRGAANERGWNPRLLYDDRLDWQSGGRPRQTERLAYNPWWLEVGRIASSWDTWAG